MGRDDLNLEELERRVAKMRALGVRQWGDIILADEDPSAPVTPSAASGGDDDVSWPESNADVYLDPFSYARGVPHLRRDS